jgi:alpha-2-macroglobulin
VQAYRLYTLALAGKPQLGAANRLRELLEPSGGVPGLMLAATYALSGQEQVARALLLQIDPPDPALPGYDPLSFGSSFRNAALGVLACKQAGLQDKALRSLNQLTKIFNSDQYLSTQEIATYFMALQACKDLFDDHLISASVRLNNQPSWEAQGRGMGYQQSLAIGQDQAQAQQLEIHNRGQKTLYARVSLSGKPLYGQEKTERKQLNMTVRYFQKDGTALDFDQLRQGQQFYAEVQLSQPSNFGQQQQLALRMVVPPGFEIVNNRLDGSLQLVGGQQAEYVDIRDDRLSAYFDLGPGREFKQRIELVATYAGKFYLPGVICEAMYSPQPYAADKGKWIEIKAAP